MTNLPRFIKDVSVSVWDNVYGLEILIIRPDADGLNLIELVGPDGVCIIIPPEACDVVIEGLSRVRQAVEETGGNEQPKKDQTNDSD